MLEEEEEDMEYYETETESDSDDSVILGDGYICRDPSRLNVDQFFTPARVHDMNFPVHLPNF